jgi:hypothetical protein
MKVMEALDFLQSNEWLRALFYLFREVLAEGLFLCRDHFLVASIMTRLTRERRPGIVITADIDTVTQVGKL